MQRCEHFIVAFKTVGVIIYFFQQSNSQTKLNLPSRNDTRDALASSELVFVSKLKNNNNKNNKKDRKKL